MNFAKTFLASLLAIVVGTVLLWIFFIMIFAGMASMMDQTVATVGERTVLRIDLANGISDSPSSSAIKSVGLAGIEFDTSNSLLQVLDAIDRAAYDDRITGIYINPRMGGASLSHIEELRSALVRFKEVSGKFVVSYSEMYTQGTYYLSSVSDRVYLNPQGGIAWMGMYSQAMFYTGLLEKLGIEVDILRHGSFKAAVEPFMLNKMSPENKEQLTVMLNSVWGTVLSDISQARGIDSAVLSNYATEMTLLRSAEASVEYGMADALVYEDQVMELLGRLSNDGEEIDLATAWIEGETAAVRTLEDEEFAEEATQAKNPKMIDLPDYIASASGSVNTNKLSKNKIAVVYVDGDIVDGTSVDGMVGSYTMIEKFARVRKDDGVKAVVVRVNSPGGSIVASELMWREMELLRQQKPVIVSMGPVAASGGYYISCPADLIIADRTTITGSIGVFGIIPNFGKALEDKLGITTDVVKTNPSADGLTLMRPLSPNERAVMMHGIEQGYSTFVQHVANGRNMLFDQVDAIGGGRVWSGVNALDNGLIDMFGGIQEAIGIAAGQANVSDDFRVWQVVDTPDNLTLLLQTLGNVRQSAVKDELGKAFSQYNALRNMVSGRSIQARMPFNIDIQ